jgi:hypothetical protein
MDLEVKGRIRIEVQSRNVHGRIYEKLQWDVPAEIRTQHLPNTNLQSYGHTGLLGNDTYK